MELTEAIKRLEIFAGQQMNEEMETAIRTVLAEMKQRVDVVHCRDCKLYPDKCEQLMFMGTDDEDNELYRFVTFCSCGERK